MSSKKIIAVVTAKGHSTGLPGKNMRMLNGIPLFWHSVVAASKAGLDVVVATDSDSIREYTHDNSASLNKKVGTVDVGSPQLLQVRTAMEYADADWFVLLQPTSPIRRVGLIREMVDTDVPCMTVEKIKPQGFWKGKFHNAPDRQIADDWFYKFDGSILVGKKSTVEKGTLFDPDMTESGLFVQDFPYIIDIDYSRDLRLASIVLQEGIV